MTPTSSSTSPRTRRAAPARRGPRASMATIGNITLIGWSAATRMIARSWVRNSSGSASESRMPRRPRNGLSSGSWRRNGERLVGARVERAHDHRAPLERLGDLGQHRDLLVLGRRIARGRGRGTPSAAARRPRRPARRACARLGGAADVGEHLDARPVAERAGPAARSSARPLGLRGGLALALGGADASSPGATATVPAVAVDDQRRAVRDARAARGPSADHGGNPERAGEDRRVTGGAAAGGGDRVRRRRDPARPPRPASARRRRRCPARRSAPRPARRAAAAPAARRPRRRPPARAGSRRRGRGTRPRAAARGVAPRDAGRRPVLDRPRAPARSSPSSSSSIRRGRRRSPPPRPAAQAQTCSPLRGPRAPRRARRPAARARRPAARSAPSSTSGSAHGEPARRARSRCPAEAGTPRNTPPSGQRAAGRRPRCAPSRPRRGRGAPCRRRRASGGLAEVLGGQREQAVQRGLAAGPARRARELVALARRRASRARSGCGRPPAPCRAWRCGPRRARRWRPAAATNRAAGRTCRPSR